jgi:hypothetical protein
VIADLELLRIAVEPVPMHELEYPFVPISKFVDIV